MRSAKFGVILSGSLITLAMALGLSGCETAQSDPPPPGQIIIVGEPEANPEPTPEAQPEGEPEAQPEPEGQPEPQPTPEPEVMASCGGGTFDAEQSSIRGNATGAVIQRLQGAVPALSGIVVELREDRGTIEPGVYDLAGTNLSDCTVCVYAVQGCGAQGCNKRFYPVGGLVEVTEYAGRGHPVELTLHGMDFREALLSAQGSEIVDGGESWCVEEHAISGRIGTLLSDEVTTDYELQNCESEEFVNIRDLVGDKAGLWLVATAGWCSACRQFIPQVINNLPMIGGMIEVIFVLGENQVYGAPSLNYCRTYSRHYEVEDASRFYIDSRGGQSFAHTFEVVQPYLGDGGEFGLPWNAMIRAEGDGWVYHYSDRAGDGRDINAGINEMLR